MTSANDKATDEQLLPLKEVMVKVGLKKTAIYDLVRNNKFPRPCKIGHSSMWPSTEVQSWIQARKQERDGLHGVAA